MHKVILEKIIVGSMEANCYLFGSSSTNEIMVIDPGGEPGRIKERISKLRLKPKLIIHTHGHYDHIGADKEFDLPVYIHRLDAEYLSNPDKNLSGFLGQFFSLNTKVIALDDGQKIPLADVYLEVIHTPGHTPGSVCLKFENLTFTGDTLFFNGVGRTDFPGASSLQLITSIKKRLLIFPDETIIYPGHGPESSIGKEKSQNFFISQS